MQLKSNSNAICNHQVYSFCCVLKITKIYVKSKISNDISNNYIKF